MWTAKHPTRCPAMRTILTWLSREMSELSSKHQLVLHVAQCAWCRQEVEAIHAVLQRDLVAEVDAAYWDVVALVTTSVPTCHGLQP